MLNVPDRLKTYLKHIIDNIDIVVFAVDAKGRFTLSEGRGLSHLNLQPGEIVGKSIFDIYKDNGEIIKSYCRALEGEPVSTTVRSDNRVYETTYTPFRSGGKITEVVGVALDITTLHESKVGFRESEKRFQLLADNIPGIIYFCRNDELYSVIYVNERVKDFTGYSKEDFETGKINFGDLYYPGEMEQIQHEVNDKLKKREPFELTYRMRHKDGSWHWFYEVGAGVFEGDEVKLLEGFITDISELKKIESDLRESERKLKTVIEKSNDAIYVLQNNQFVLINKKFQEMFGYTLEETTANGFSFMKLVAEESYDLIADRKRKRERGEPVQNRVNFVALAKDGKKYNVEASLSNIEWDGKPAVLGILHDESKRIQLEKQLRQLQKMEAIGILAGGVAHDFNNILTAITGYAELLDNKLKDSDGVHDYVKQIISASERATNLVQQLLAFSRKQIVKPIAISLNETLASMGGLLERIIGEDVELKTLLSKDIGTIEIDPTLIEQVILNIVVNARDAMPHGGKLILETFNADLDEEYADSHPEVTPGSYVTLAISDTGNGMTEEVRNHIFEPFFTTKEQGKGSGLGLSTVYGIIKQSGGHIWCYSEPDKGTTFKIYIPRVDKPVEQRKKTIRKAELPKGNETILIVEDEEPVRGLCMQILKSLGYNVMGAQDGSEAVKIFKANDQRIDLLIADVIMPGMNGKVLASQLIEVQPDLKVIYISGYTDNIVVHHGILDSGINFIQKPFTPTKLAVQVREILDGRASN